MSGDCDTSKIDMMVQQCEMRGDSTVHYRYRISVDGNRWMHVVVVDELVDAKVYPSHTQLPERSSGKGRI